MTSDLTIKRHKSVELDDFEIEVLIPVFTLHKLKVSVSNFPLTMEKLGITDGEVQAKILALEDGKETSFTSHASREELVQLGFTTR